MKIGTDGKLTLRVALPQGADGDVERDIDTQAMKKMREHAANNCMRINDIQRDVSYERQTEKDGKSVWTPETSIPPDSLTDELPRRTCWTYTVQCVPAERVAVLANSVEDAVRFANDFWKGKSLEVIALTEARVLAKLFYHQGTPYVVVPGTDSLHWHSQLAYHVRCGRIVPVDVG